MLLAEPLAADPLECLGGMTNDVGVAENHRIIALCDSGPRALNATVGPAMMFSLIFQGFLNISGFSSVLTTPLRVLFHLLQSSFVKRTLHALLYLSFLWAAEVPTSFTGKYQ